MSQQCYTHLSAEDRETLSLGMAQGHSLRMMARVLGRAPSTVSRESARNGTRGRPYRACTAHTLTTVRARQPPRPRKLLDPWLWQYVRTSLAGCSPEQMAGRLRRKYPDDMGRHLSTETIYAALRQAHKARRPRARGIDRRGQIPNMTPIAERPAEVATRTVLGHGEGDLLQGVRNGSAVGTLVERTTRLVILAKMNGTDATSARAGFTKTLRPVPALLRNTLTSDRGNERAEHEPWAQRLAIQICFADPYSPWQRGTNENTNGLLRQYLPKGTDSSRHTQRELNAIAHRLNPRPRHVSTSPRRWESIHTCMIIHPLHLELDTARINSGMSHVRKRDILCRIRD